MNALFHSPEFGVCFRPWVGGWKLAFARGRFRPIAVIYLMPGNVQNEATPAFRLPLPNLRCRLDTTTGWLDPASGERLVRVLH